MEVLVVDGGSTDGTRDLVRERMTRWDRLFLLDNPGRRSSAGRNVGARAAAGDLIVFLDGHCSLLRPDYLARLVEIFAESGADCLTRPQPLTELTGTRWERAVALARHSPLGHKPGSEIYRAEPGFTDPQSAGAAYRREVLETLGGYDERFQACEDVEFNVRVARAGFRAYHQLRDDVLTRPLEILDGMITVPQAPGLGVEVDRTQVERYQVS